MRDHDNTPSDNAEPTPVAYDGDEWAGPDDRCTCGRPAIIIYLTEAFGRVGYCGIPNARPLKGPSDDALIETRNGHDRPPTRQRALTPSPTRSTRR